MVFIAEKESLLNAIGKVIGAIDKRQISPALSALKIEVSPGCSTVTGTDLEIFASAEFPSEGDSRLAFCVEADTIKHAVSLSPGPKIEIDHKENEISIISGGFICNLPVFPADEFPMDENSETDIYAIGDGGMFGAIQAAVGHAVSRDDATKHHLCGIYFARENDNLTCVAADGHRLSLVAISSPSVDAFRDGVIISKKTMVLLSKIDSWSSVSRPNKNLIRFDGPSAEISSRLIDHPYPAYRRIIDVHEKGFCVDSEALISALSACIVVVDDKRNKSVTLECRDDVLVVSGLSDKGRATYEVPYHGDSGLKVIINASYLSQALVALGGEVCIKFSDNQTPLVIFPVDHKCWNERLEVIMPMRH